MRTTMAVLLATTTLSSPALAGGVPVYDGVNAGFNSKTLIETLNMVKQGALEIEQLTHLANLETIAGQVFGETGAGFGAVMNAGQGAYTASNSAYSSVLGVQQRFAGGLDCLAPPPEGYATMGISGAMSRLRCGQRLVSGTNQAAVRALADRLDLQRSILEQESKAGVMSGSSVSPIQATQAQTLQLRALAERMANQEQALNDMVQLAAAEGLKRNQEYEFMEGLRDQSSAIRQNIVDGEVPQPEHGFLD